MASKMMVMLVTLVLVLRLCGAAPFVNAPPDEDGGGEKEQRELDFPNTSVIPGDLTEELGVDFFFSLWTVLQDEDITTSDVPFTIFAPSNLAKRPSQSVLGSTERLKKLILRHIVLGTKVLSTEVIASNSSVSVTALDGSSLELTHSSSGILVNSVRVLKSDVFVPQGTLLVLEDYLLDPAEGMEDGRIPMIEFGTREEGELAPLKLEDIDLEFGRRVFEAMANETKPFYEELIDVLSLLQSGTSEFRRYLLQVNISQYFTNDGEYTAFIPLDDAFQKWYPIDWGFNPFEVPQFAKTTILNHIVVGKVKQQSSKDGGILTTLGGKQIIIKKSPTKGITLNGVPVFDGDTPTSHGNVWFIRDILFVDSGIVRSLQIENKDKETAPLVTFPWYNSQFLSHLFTELEERKDFTYLVDWLNRTNEFADDLPSHDTNFSMIRYTFFAPKDDAVKKALTAETLEDIMNSDSSRKKLLMDHTVKGRFYRSDLQEGTTLETISGKELKFHEKEGKLYVNKVFVSETEVYIYNLGNLFVLEGVLFDAASNVEVSDSEMMSTEALSEPPAGRSARQAPSGGAAVFKNSVFLSEALKSLQAQGDQYASIARYLSTSPGLETAILRQGGSQFTLFAPTNFGFRRWMLADSADPFFVNEGLRQNTLLNLMVKGKVTIEDLKNGATFTTVSGKKFTVNAADGVISLSDRSRVVGKKEISLTTGTVIAVDSPIFVDFQAMESAVSEFHKKRNIMPRVNPTNDVTEIRGYYAYHAPERGKQIVTISYYFEKAGTNPHVNPFVRKPDSISIPAPPHSPKARSVITDAPESINVAPSSFWSNLREVLSARDDLRSFRSYLEGSSDIEAEIRQGEAAGNEYTLIAPNNFGIRRYMRADSIDPFITSEALRKQMIADHIVKGKIDFANVADGTKLETLSGKTIEVKVTLDGEKRTLLLGERAKVEAEVATPSGPILITNSLISLDREAMDQAYAEYYEKNPSVGPFGVRVQPTIVAPTVGSGGAIFANSPFLKSAYDSLANQENFRSFRRYLERTPEFENQIQGSEYTLIMPTNFGFSRWFMAGAADPFYVSDNLRKNMLLDHTVKGRLTKESLVDGATLETLSGKSIPVKVAEDGTITFGERAKITSTAGLDDENAPFVVTNSILFVDRVAMEQAVREHSQKRVPPVRSSVAVPEPATITVGEPAAPLFGRSAILAKIYGDIKTNPDFRAFRSYLELSPDFQDELVTSKGEQYTLVMPKNFGFSRWFMADAVDPIYVDEELRKITLRDHVVIGKLTKESLVDGAKLETLSGKTIDVKVSSDGAISLGTRATVTDTAGLDDGVAPYLVTDSMLFVDFDAMSSAVSQYYAKNPPKGPFGVEVQESISLTADAVVPAKPSFRSPFLTKAYEVLEGKDDYSAFRRYLGDTPEFGNEFGWGAKAFSYTLVLPQNFGIFRWLPQDTADPFSVDASLRKQMLADQVFRGRIKVEDLVDGKEFVTLSKKTVKVSVKDGVITLGDRATVVSTSGLGERSSPYITTDSLIFVDQEGIQKALRTYSEANPRKGPFGIAPPAITAVNVEADETAGSPSSSAKPSFSSPFLTKAYDLLEGKEDFSDFRRYLAETPEFGKEFGFGAKAFAYTLVAPENFGIYRWIPQDTVNPYSVSVSLRKQMLADQVIRGQIAVADLVDGAEFTTLSMKTIKVSVKDGVITLGERAMVVSTEGLSKSAAPYMTTNSLLFVDFDGIQEALKVYHQSNPRKGPFGIAPPAITAVNVEADETAGSPTSSAKPSFRSPFLTKAYELLEGKEDYSDFRRYLADTPEFGNEFGFGAKAFAYTLVVPQNFGIYRWIPQDTVNPFSVSASLRKQMLADQVIRGRIAVADLVDGAEFTTLSMKTVKVSVKDGVVSLGDRAVIVSNEGLSESATPYITTDSLVFVDFDGIQEALKVYHQSNPVVRPWFARPEESASITLDVTDGVHPFVQKAKEVLKAVGNEVATFSDYLDRSPGVLKGVARNQESATQYTLFAPENWGIFRNLPQDTADPFSIDEEFRTQMITDHIVSGRIEKADIVEGAKFTTVNGKTIEVTRGENGEEALNERSRVVSGPQPVGDEGLLYVVDGLLFNDGEGISAVLQKHASEIGSPFLHGPEELPVSVEAAN